MFNDTDRPQKCHLLELPAELRECIWQYALTEEETICFYWDHNTCYIPEDPPPFEAPGLLSTCHQIRNEALPTYYVCNEFRIESESWHASRLIALEMECKTMGVLNKMELAITVATDLDEPAIRLWCKHIHDGGKWRPRIEDNGFAHEVFYFGAFDITEAMRDTTWEKCKRVLDIYMLNVDQVLRGMW